MTQETIKIKKLIAADGMVLTNGESYGKEVFLGINDDASNWREIAEEEYEQSMNDLLHSDDWKVGEE